MLLPQMDELRITTKGKSRSWLATTSRGEPRSQKAQEVGGMEALQGLFKSWRPLDAPKQLSSAPVL